jgi:hypothetical protein
MNISKNGCNKKIIIAMSEVVLQYMNIIAIFSNYCKFFIHSHGE